jgi:hypothetical protein
MTISRRRFPFALGAATFCLSNADDLAQASSQTSAQVNAPKGDHYLFQDETFEIIFLTSLGRAYHSGGDVGKVLYLTRQVKDGDFESAYRAFKQAGDEARAVA